MNDSHGGNIRALSEESGLPPSQILDFSANINPLGPPPSLGAALRRAAALVTRYPDRFNTAVTDAVASHHGLPRERVIVGAGATELLSLLPAALGCRSVLVPRPSYLEYALVCAQAGCEVQELFMKSEDGFAFPWEEAEEALGRVDSIILGSPNNPTGLCLSRERLLALVGSRPGVFFVIDDSFVEFLPEPSRATLLGEELPNLVVVRSLTKFFAVPSLRLGFAAGPPALVEKLRARQSPWSVNGFAQEAGVSLFSDPAYFQETRRVVEAGRAYLQREIDNIENLKCYPGEANFLLVEIHRGGPTSSELRAALLARGVAVRDCANFPGLGDRFFRVAVRTAEENARLVDALREALHRPAPSARPGRRRKTARAIMLQGTSSNAGKSILTAALCRIFLQDGLRVAPFKAQNMALNSFVTRRGEEMGRAQVVQARACRLDPDVRMNPVLLKPNSDTGSQVIVMGKPVGNLTVESYIDFKAGLFETVAAAYDSLAGEYDVLVLEGAGSPAEVNLKAHDIVNMRMAAYAQAPVLLVGDIDRGGVFAGFLGTYEILDAAERELLGGFVINKFRGRKELLGPALDFIRWQTGKEVLGIVPMIAKLGLPEEDSVQFKESRVGRDEGAGDIAIAVLDLPHISNFTDFDPLFLEPGVRVRVVAPGQPLGEPDCVIIPGSKNTGSDFAYLMSEGYGAEIVGLAARGRHVVGICGGFQMLGKSIADPLALEFPGGRVDALGLLDMDTTLDSEKTLCQVEAVHAASGIPVRGYEIHNGKSAVREGLRPFLYASGEPEGAQSGNVWGTYIHGVFDSDAFRHWFLGALRAAKGLPALEAPGAEYEEETAYERLASVVRDSLAMDCIYNLMGLGG